ncbi:hypothetical protein P4S83_08880 [Aneurinibacillus thermoaerophilus]|uniref:hypothetical protein n=1 Tax=Aneurinibacillus thermoaerophilus TaxID=143495 RepID=UPI002E1DA261|nr:hypothetical protein [Aneurinibacillus thermoaerophilus]MED0763751.1 hypothetical protein [Aneurinibacillus thermoaerophilus]
MELKLDERSRILLVSGTKVTVKVDVRNFDRVDFSIHTMPMAEQGHLHFWLETDVFTLGTRLMFYDKVS